MPNKMNMVFWHAQSCNRHSSIEKRNQRYKDRMNYRTKCDVIANTDSNQYQIVDKYKFHRFHSSNLLLFRLSTSFLRDRFIVMVRNIYGITEFQTYNPMQCLCIAPNDYRENEWMRNVSEN